MFFQQSCRMVRKVMLLKKQLHLGYFQNSYSLNIFLNFVISCVSAVTKFQKVPSTTHRKDSFFCKVESCGSRNNRKELLYYGGAHSLTNVQDCYAVVASNRENSFLQLFVQVLLAHKIFYQNLINLLFVTLCIIKKLISVMWTTCCWANVQFAYYVTKR